MKKKILLLIILLFMPLLVFAKDDVISSFDMDIYIDNEGSAHVTETWVATANMGTEFYHSYKNLGTSVITDFSVSMDGKDYTYIDYWDLDASLKEKEYKNGFNYIDDGIELCFGKTSMGTHTYISKYTISNFVVDLNDSQMIYWTLLPSNNGGQFKQVHIKIYSDEEYLDTLPVWGYGNYGGTCYVANGYIEMNLDRQLNDDEYMTILVKYPSNTFNLATKLNKNFETYLDMANYGSTYYNDSKYKIQNLVDLYLIYVVIVWFIITISITIYIYIKYDKEYLNELNIDYYRDFPSNDSPAVVEYLFKKNITTTSFSSSILNMIYKKAILVTETEITTGLFHNKKEKDYVFKKSFDELKEPLSVEEEYLINALFNNFGDMNGGLCLSTLKNVSDSEADAKDFINIYNKWMKISTLNAKSRNFYENKKISSMLYLYMYAFISIVLSFLLLDYTSMVLFVIIFSIIFMVYISVVRKRTKMGNELYIKWNALKKFLNDFGNFSAKELPEIKLWEKYLVYAHVFGIADKLRKDMNLKIPELGETNLDTFDYMYINHSLDRAITSNVSHALASAHSKLAESYSSGGGGFSSGGGGGGSFGGGGGAGGR